MPASQSVLRRSWSSLLITCLVSVLLIPTPSSALPVSDTGRTFEGDKVQLLKRYYQGGVSGPDSWAGSSTTPYKKDDELEVDARDVAQHYVFWTAIANNEGETISADFARQNNGQTAADSFGPGYICQIEDEEGENWWANFVDRASGVFADRAGQAHNERSVSHCTK